VDDAFERALRSGVSHIVFLGAGYDRTRPSLFIWEGVTYMDPEMVPGWLARFGYHVKDHVDAGQMVERYLTLPDGSVAERPFARIRLLCAERASGA
jgi:O-methyltransferase involved in polyketide biosynthesis